MKFLTAILISSTFLLLSGCGTSTEKVDAPKSASADSTDPTLYFSDGYLMSTHRKFDLAIRGPGFFVLNAPDGEPAFTRAGSFAKSVDGMLTSREGYPLQGYSIEEDGKISSQLSAIYVSRF